MNWASRLKYEETNGELGWVNCPGGLEQLIKKLTVEQRARDKVVKAYAKNVADSVAAINQLIQRVVKGLIFSSGYRITFKDSLAKLKDDLSQVLSEKEPLHTVTHRYTPLHTVTHRYTPTSRRCALPTPRPRARRRRW